MNHDDNAEIRTKITEGRPEAGSALPVLQFHFADADLGILCHDLLADDPDRAPGGRRQPETDDRDLRTRVIRMHRLYRLCGKPVLPQEVRQIGTLMALGASRRRLAPGLFREVFTLSTVSALAGLPDGLPVCLDLMEPVPYADRGQRTDGSRPRFPLSACIDPVFPDRCTLLLYHGIPLSETDKHHGYDPGRT